MWVARTMREKQLPCDAPDDPQATARGDQFFWGRDILVSPVVEKGATSRRLYLPRGRWVDFWKRQAGRGSPVDEAAGATWDTARARRIGVGRVGVTAALMVALPLLAGSHSVRQPDLEVLRNPDHPEMTRAAPAVYRVLLDTSKGPITIEVHRDWSPHGADRFYNLVRHGYYDDARFFRVIAGRWAQFGISGVPEIARIWRTRTIPDDPRKAPNLRGTVAYAFRDPNGRTTQVFINLQDNRATHDEEPFVPFGRVVEGMEVADALYSGYGEASGGGIRAGRQDRLFAEGDAYLLREFPRLDYIRRATIRR